jgi:hypothetical protein
MDNPPIKNWMKKQQYDPFEGATSFRECSVCKWSMPVEQYADGIEYASSVCNNCLQRFKCNKELLEKFVLWSRTSKEYKAINSVTASMLSDYSAGKIEHMVLSAIVNKDERKTLYENLIAFLKGDAGDQLLLLECMEALSNLQEENEEK